MELLLVIVVGGDGECGDGNFGFDGGGDMNKRNGLYPD